MPRANRSAYCSSRRRRAAEIVHNLTYFSRPPATGKTPRECWRGRRAHAKPACLFAAQEQHYRRLLREPGLPYVEGDPHQLMQVFWNLILNAEQAIREAARPRNAGASASGNYWAVGWASFQDDGRGFPVNFAQHFPYPFYTRRERPGRGTGLRAQHLQVGDERTQRTIEAANTRQVAEQYSRLPCARRLRQTETGFRISPSGKLPPASKHPKPKPEARSPKPGSPRPGFNPFPLHGNGIASAEAECGDPALGIAAGHFINQGDKDARAAGPDRMPDRNCAAIHVDPVGIEPKFTHHTQRPAPRKLR